MVIGLRDNNGIVNKLSPLDISDIEQATVMFLLISFTLYVFCIDSIHGPVNHSSISLHFLPIFLKNM
jgi:hypothetical protein